MNTLTKIILGLGVLVFALPLLAQPGAPPATPIDGGLSLLLAGGAAYGINKITKKTKKPNS
jgi:hypothetical protein